MGPESCGGDFDLRACRELPAAENAVLCQASCNVLASKAAWVPSLAGSDNPQLTGAVLRFGRETGLREVLSRGLSRSFACHDDEGFCLPSKVNEKPSESGRTVDERNGMEQRGAQPRCGCADEESDVLHERHLRERCQERSTAKVARIVFDSEEEGGVKAVQRNVDRVQQANGDQEKHNVSQGVTLNGTAHRQDRLAGQVALCEAAMRATEWSVMCGCS